LWQSSIPNKNVLQITLENNRNIAESGVKHHNPNPSPNYFESTLLYIWEFLLNLHLNKICKHKDLFSFLFVLFYLFNSEGHMVDILSIFMTQVFFYWFLNAENE
jgi:hypothetical protein